MTIEDKGLPFHKNPYKFGNLFVLFNIKFPDSLDSSQVNQVKTMLKNQRKQNNDEDMDADDTIILKPYHESQKNTHAQGGTKAYNSDGEEDEDEPRGHGQRAQCA